MTGYYAERLAGERLREVYEIAPARVRQYLDAEIAHVRDRLRPADRVLELGCGYGRAAFPLAQAAAHVVGIDSAVESLRLARRPAGGGSCRGFAACDFLAMDAVALGFRDGAFDLVACVQNGVCAFGVDRLALVREAVRVTRPGGLVLFSSYAAAFWPHRLHWFELQAERGLLGPLDREASRDGVIVCRDGFRAAAMSPEEFRALCGRMGLAPAIREVDGSSLFCEITVPAHRTEGAA